MPLSKDINLSVNIFKGVTMKRISAVLSFMTLLLFFSSINLAAQKGPGPDKGKDRHCMWGDLNLTKEQQAQFKTLHEEMKGMREKHMEAVKTVREKMKVELLKAEPSQNTLYGYAAELGELHKQMTRDRSDHLLKVKKVLTPEQFSKLVEREDAMERGKGFGPHQGPGDHPHQGDMSAHKDAACPHKGAPPPKGNCPRDSGTGEVK